MASSTRDLIIRILADTKDLTDGVAKAEGTLGKLKSAAIVAGGAIAAGFAADKVVDFLGESVKAAEEDRQSQKILAQQIKDTTGATDAQIAGVEKFIDSTARQTGVLDDQLRPAYTSLLRGTKDAGEAEKELALAQDIAAARGVDLTAVTTALEKAHNGNVGALGRLGLATKDAEGNALSLQQVMEQGAKTYAGAAEAAVTPSQRWSVAFQELKEQVGTALLPVLDALATFMAEKLLPAIQNAVAWVEANWPRFSKAVIADFDKVKGYIIPVVQEIQDLWDRFGTHIIEVGKGTWDVVVGQIKTAIALIQAVVQPIVDLLHGDWGKAWDDFAKRIGQAFDGMLQTVKGIFEVFKGELGGLEAAVGNIIKQIVHDVASIPGQIYDALPGPVQGALKAAGWATGVTPLVGAAKSVLGHIGLADGGVVTSPMLRLVGEAGPEAVIPLSRLGDMGGGGGTVINIAQVTVADTRAFVEVLQTIDRTYGGVPINVRTPA